MAKTTTLRAKVLATAMKEVNKVFPDGTTIPYVETYNKLTKTLFNPKETPWGAIFVSVMFRAAGVPETVCPNFAGCMTLANSFVVPNGYWRDKKSYTPKQGDIVFFISDLNLPHNYTQVAIVDRVEGGKLYCIEGNCSSGAHTASVRHKAYYVAGTYIAGYGAIPYESQSASKVTAPSSEIKAFQEWLNKTYNIRIGVVPTTGVYDSYTHKAAIYAMQIEFMKLSNKNAPAMVLGVFDEGTKKNAVTIKKLDSTGLVGIAMGMLYGKGYNPGKFGTVFEESMEASVRAFQKANCLTVNGTIGPNTWAKLAKG